MFNFYNIFGRNKHKYCELDSDDLLQMPNEPGYSKRKIIVLSEVETVGSIFSVPKDCHIIGTMFKADFNNGAILIVGLVDNRDGLGQYNAVVFIESQSGEVETLCKRFENVDQVVVLIHKVLHDPNIIFYNLKG